MVIPFKVNAVSYEEITRDVFQYNINNFYLEGDYIIINGWAVTSGHQHLTGDDTHEYSLTVTDTATNITKTYIASLKAVDKTALMKIHDQTNMCGRYTFYQPDTVCYYSLTKVGFEFKIPLSDLSGNKEYALKLRICEKLINRGFQLSFYALGIDDVYKKNGIQYQLYSDINKTYVKIDSTMLFVRSGPGTNYPVRTSSISCNGNRNVYWFTGGTYTNVIQVHHANKGAIDSETWVNIRYNLGGCYGGRSRAVNGTTYDGWGPWVYMEASGEPAIIKTSTLNNTSIEELRTYTAEKNTYAKVGLTLRNSINQTVNIKGYHDSNLVYEVNETFNGTKSFNFNYVIPDNGVFKVVITEPFGYTVSKESRIYISNKKVYNLDSDFNEELVIETPILVVTDRDNNMTEYREKVKLSVDPTSIVLSQGRKIDSNTTIWYFKANQEFSLNENFSVFALFPNQEDSLDFDIVDEKVKVDYKTTSLINENEYDVGHLKIKDDMLIDTRTGKIYTADNIPENIKIFDGGNAWYVPWNEDLKFFNYQIIAQSLGVNKVTIIKDCSYEITNTFLGINTGDYYIKRVKTPSNLNYIYKKTYTYNQMIDLVGGDNK